MEQELTPPAAFEIQRRWERKWWGKHHIEDRVTEGVVIATRRSKYVCPDLLDLMGHPQDTDFTDSGAVKVERKAELMLIGVFRWRGLAIARDDREYASPGWLALPAESFDWRTPLYLHDQIAQAPYLPCPQEHWTEHDRREVEELRKLRLPRDFLKDGVLWKARDSRFNSVHRHEYWIPYFSEPGYFEPFYGYTGVRRLEHVLYEEELSRNPGKRLIFVDGNPYNCSPENLQLRSKRGRPMRCSLCGAEVTREASVRFKSQGRYMRICRWCLRAFDSGD